MYQAFEFLLLMDTTYKQIIYELDSILKMFSLKNVDESNIGTSISRLNRIIEIQKILVDQIRVLETMTPMDFLDFRDLLVYFYRLNQIYFL